ncbi:hypothetical protein GJ744_006952 [Endocarpon pusillum]|uniref:Uncharacterized protein n=1 Tax=Endocarpon pusillum TaxID=364733 RepID=A0A8H7AND1_9EURO|nr:hypothetical protein GJ744_006952 [Endocarpon pusillum]
MADRVLAIDLGGADTHLSARHRVQNDYPLSLKRGISSSSFRPSLSPLDRVLTVALLLVLFSTTTEAAHYSKCCVLGARDQLNIFTELPWDVCNYNKNVSYPFDPVPPSVNRTKGWCMDNCQGTQWSNATQWIQPLAAWIAPYIGLLLLCPVGEKPEKKGEKPQQKPEWTCQEAYKRCCNAAEYLRFPAQEYVMLIGDPASALWGSFAALRHDWVIVKNLDWRPQQENSYLKRGLVILAGETLYDPALTGKLDEKITRLVGKIHPGEQPVEQKMTYNPRKTTAVDTISEKDLPSVSTPSGVAPTSNILVDDHKLPDELARALRTVLEARVPFVNAIALPAVLMLAVVASVFYDAYNKLGDNDTAHSIAYGVFYSWIVVLAVIGNCAATSVNAGVLDTTVGGVVGLKFNPQVPLRKRYSNAVLWDEWISGKKVHSGWYFHLKFLSGQVLGWLVVASSCACAASISYTTPTVGLGCRSFTFVLYGVLAFAVACLLVLRHSIRVKVDLCEGAGSDSKRNWTRLGVAVRYVYAFLVLCNACLLVLGTAFNLAGLYRTCRCKLLFASMDTLVELNTNTQRGLDNARKFWFPVGYVAFTLVWILCAVAVALRKHMILQLVSALEGRSGDLESLK